VNAPRNPFVPAKAGTQEAELDSAKALDSRLRGNERSLEAGASRPLAPAASIGEAEQAIANLNVIMNRLVGTVEEETAHMRAGRIRDALALDGTKAQLARSYAAESARLKAAREVLGRAAPEALDKLIQRHHAFQALLQTNLVVLATAHAVSEGIIRGVSGELNRKRTPQTYGVTGRAAAPPRRSSPPLALSRSL
jgi:hypothetical protein